MMAKPPIFSQNETDTHNSSALFTADCVRVHRGDDVGSKHNQKRDETIDAGDRNFQLDDSSVRAANIIYAAKLKHAYFFHLRLW
jgi:hypothetical protein